MLEACPLSFVLCRSYAAPRGAAYEGQIVNSFVEAGAALPPRLIGIKQIEDCCLCVIEAAGHLGINTPIAPGGVAVMVPDPSPWLRSWISAYPLGSRLFAYSPSPREASGQIIKSSGFERVVKIYSMRSPIMHICRDEVNMHQACDMEGNEPGGPTRVEA